MGVRLSAKELVPLPSKFNTKTVRVVPAPVILQGALEPTGVRNLNAHLVDLWLAHGFPFG